MPTDTASPTRLDKLDRMKSEGRPSDDEYQRLRGRLVA
jgi:hypothetical protein